MRVAASLALMLLVTSGHAQVWEKAIAPGLTYRMEYDATAPRLINALRVTPGAPDVKMRAELAGGTINEAGTVKGRLSPAKIAGEAKAIAAINADFFSFDHGAPIGLMIRDGELLTTPFRNRSVLAWGSQVAFAIPTFAGSVRDEDGLTLALDSINQPVAANQVALYTPASGEVQIGGENLMALIKVDDAVVRPNSTMFGTVDYLIADARKMNVPAGKVLLVARGSRAPILAGLRPDRKVHIKLETQGFDWSGVEHAIGGGPFLVRNGAVSVDAQAQGFNSAFADGRHPRTAVGRTKDGDLWFVTIDGRQSISIGASLRETAEVMLKLGCVEAMNFDGGGSTNLHVLGVTVNRPSDKAERPVSNAVLFYAPLSLTGGQQLTLEAPPTLEAGKQISAKALMGGKALPDGEVIWGMQGAAWVDQGGTVRALEPGRAVLNATWRGVTARVTIEVTPKKAPPKVGDGK